MGQLDGKTCLVTGGAGSIGLAAAKLFVSEGARVMLADLGEAPRERMLGLFGGEALDYAACDVSLSGDVSRLVEATVARFGKIDVLFSNAGNFGTVSPIGSYPEDIFDAVYAVHVRGAFLMAKHAVGQMNDGGSIIITSSVAATRGDPGVYAYITAKHAQVGLMRCLAKELAPRRIRVNTLHPGPIDNAFQGRVEADITPAIGRDATQFFNDMIPLGRHGTADEIARAALFLASDQSSFTTGAMIMADGGMSA
jgi:NAD(P)-dependent dehydrogenase (short-subunit alcohol dehydrogenase family)